MPASDRADPADWRSLNHAWWDERAPLHEQSSFYRDAGDGLEGFEWDEIGPVDGLDIVHPQCHLGTDTISLARAGGRTVGLDFSANALDGAGRLAAEAGVTERTEWVVSDLYDAPAAFGGRRFDLVYTGKGALCWLPDILRWAEVMFSLTRPGGTLYLSEMHPFQDIMSDDDTDVERSYFPDGGDVFDAPGSYVDRTAETAQNVTVDFVHPISSVVQAVLDAGFVLRLLHEHDFTVYERWPWLETTGDGVWRMPAGRPALPLLYSLKAERPA
jgi:SAM-dependent methyltransferase